MADGPDETLSPADAADELRRLRALDTGTRQFVEGITFTIWGLALFGVMLSFLVFPIPWAGYVWVVGVGFASLLTFGARRAAAVHLEGTVGGRTSLVAIGAAVFLAFAAYSALIFLGLLAYWIPFDLLFVSLALLLISTARFLSTGGRRTGIALAIWGLVVGALLTFLQPAIVAQVVLQALAFLMWSVAGIMLTLKG